MLYYREATDTLRFREVLWSNSNSGWRPVLYLILDHDDRTGELRGSFLTKDAYLKIGAMLVLQRCPGWEVLVTVTSKGYNKDLGIYHYAITNRDLLGFLCGNPPVREEGEPLDLDHLKHALAGDGVEQGPIAHFNAEGRLRIPTLE